MLSKVKDKYYTKQVAVSTNSGTIANQSETTILSYTPTEAGTYIAKAKGHTSSETWYWQFRFNNTYVNVYGVDWKIYEFIYEDFSTTINIFGRGGLNNVSTHYLYYDGATIEKAILEFTADIAFTWIPKVVNSIWEQGIAIIFWVLNDGSRKKEPITSEFSSTASTGSITPGNYVGYVTIEAKDGTIYKVWVYNT